MVALLKELGERFHTAPFSGCALGERVYILFSKCSAPRVFSDIADYDELRKVSNFYFAKNIIY